MNRPSRTDDDLVHPTWNQNPPFLAPDLTTREDLNGIANSRELKSAAGGAAAALSLLSERSLFSAQNNLESDDCRFLFPLCNPTCFLGVRTLRPPQLTRSLDSCLRVEIVPLQERLHRLFSRISHSKAWSWTWWAVSVLAMSTLLSTLGLTPTRAAAPAPATTQPATAADLLPPPPPPAPRSLSRRDECESGGVRGDYDVPLHVGALLIVMFVSTLACLFSLLARRFPRLRIPDGFFFAIRHFGTGVLIATAFIHLLPTAFISLGDPCLSAFWTTDYPAMPGAIALAGVFFVIIIEMVLSPARRFPPRGDLTAASTPAGNRSRVSLGDGRGGAGAAGSPSGEVEMSSSFQLDRVAPAGQITPGDADVTASGVKSPGENDGRDIELLTPGHFLTEEQKLQKEILQCVLLEIGILFHSVFIGMALSVAVGHEFIVLLIAIVFHRTC